MQSCWTFVPKPNESNSQSCLSLQPNACGGHSVTHFACVVTAAAMYVSSGGAPAPAPEPMPATETPTETEAPAESGYGPGTEMTPTTHN